MQRLNKLRKFDICILVLSFIILNPFWALKIRSNPILNNNTLENQSQKDSYILGPGDAIYIYFLNNPEYNREYKILNDGTISLPFINNVYISGKTIDESTLYIEAKLNNEFINAKIFLTLIKTRPVSVSIIGEVIKPGFYTLDVANNSSNISSKNNLTLGPPTLVDLIKRSGGITKNSDIENIEIFRKLPDSSSNEFKKAKVDFVKFLLDGDQTQNPILFDGDILKIPKGVFDLKTYKISRANLSPDKIKVNVIGEVVQPGSKELEPNATLLEAIYSAGGISPSRGQYYNIELFRINNDGNSEYRKFNFDRKVGFSNKVNPQLAPGDVVKVNRNLISKFGDTVKPVTEPLTGILSIIRLIDLLGN